MKNIIAALLSVQAELKPFLKDKVNPFYNSKFVELSTILESILPLFNKHKIILLQPTDMENGTFVVRTRLVHESGEEISSVYVLDCEKSSPQKLAATLTFARRYALVSLIGIACEEEDDGNSASGKSINKTNKKPVELTIEQASSSGSSDGKVPKEISYSAFTPVNFSEKNFGTDEAPKWSYSVQDNNKFWYSAWDDDLGALLKEAHENQQEIKIGWRIKGKYKNIVDVNPAVTAGEQG